MRLELSLSVGFLTAGLFATIGVVRPVGAQEAEAGTGGTTEGLPAVPEGLNDTVALKNDGLLRGTIIVIDPGNEVVVLVPGRGEMRIAWDDVERIEKGGGEERVSPRASSPDASPKRVEPPRPHDEVVGPLLKIEADDDDVRLYRESGLVGWSPTGELVCDPPCDAVIDASKPGRYYFAGDGIAASEKFSLRGQTGALTARVDAAPSGLLVGGVIVLATGIATTVGGAVMLIGHAVVEGQANVRTDFDFSIPGGISVGVGAIAIAGGIAMILFGETEVEWLKDGRELELGMTGLGYHF